MFEISCVDFFGEYKHKRTQKFNFGLFLMVTYTSLLYACREFIFYPWYFILYLFGKILFQRLVAPVVFRCDLFPLSLACSLTKRSFFFLSAFFGWQIVNKYKEESSNTWNFQVECIIDILWVERSYWWILSSNWDYLINWNVV